MKYILAVDQSTSATKALIDDPRQTEALATYYFLRGTGRAVSVGPDAVAIDKMNVRNG